jgi:hypothetical protein
VAGWRANAVGASAALADGQSEPARRSAQRDPDKDRIAQLERERDDLLKIVRELRERLEKLEANRKPEVVAGEGLLLGKLKERDQDADKDALKRSILEDVKRKQQVEAQRERVEAERARLEAERAQRGKPKVVDGGPPPEIADKLRKLKDELKHAELGGKLKTAGDLAEKMKALELDAEKLAKLKDRIPADAFDKLKALELDVQKLAKLKELQTGDLVDKMKALELDAQKLAKMKALQDGRDPVQKVKDKSGDRVAALEDRVKAMEVDLKKMILMLEQQRKIK